MTVDLVEKAHYLRNQVLEMCIKAGTGHVTSCFSCVEILVALFYGGIMKEGDRFLLSKGHASPLLYAILADKGFFPEEELWKFNQADGIFGVHLQHDVPGALITAGSLGYGLGIGVGMALADRGHDVFVLLGDGECYEGSIWEAAMFASHYKLTNLIAIVDRNHLCATGFTSEVVNLDDLVHKWDAFGWEASGVDGHSFDLLLWLLRQPGGPFAIVANTVKGKGILFLENKPLWHGIAPTRKQDIERARRELNDGY